MMYRTF